jgi:hypothetical protein
MKFRVFASFVGMNDNWGNGWGDYELLVWSNSYKNAKRKIWNWAKRRGATQRQIQFVDEEMWKRDRCGGRHYIK